jgi:hypothetical protein
MTTYDPDEPLRAMGELRQLDREPDWTDIEEHLLTVSVDVPPVHDVSTGRGTYARLSAAAACMVLAAALTSYTTSWRPGIAPAAPPDSPAPPPTPAAAERVVESTASAESAKSPPRRVAPPRRPRRASTPRSQQAQREFIVLPGAAGLPAFESGRVVRVDMPVGVLPAYGLDVVPDASPGVVSAEFLIGQDGVPRAIRLASASPR